MQINVIETRAMDLRAVVRRKAGLEPDWESASEEMKAFYRRQAKRIESANNYAEH